MFLSYIILPILQLHKTVPLIDESIIGDILLAKDGPGMMYYRFSLTVSPADFHIVSKEQGFALTRTYKAYIPSDITPSSKDYDEWQKKVELKDNIWRVKKGSLVQVTVTMV